jgi:hypothetical protein
MKEERRKGRKNEEESKKGSGAKNEIINNKSCF